MAIVFIFCRDCFIVGKVILKSSWKFVIEGIWIVARAPTVITRIGATFHPLACMLFQSG
jgi:hypothetical protein